METQFKKLAGVSLLIGAILATFTMALHPVGGSLSDIAKQKVMFMFTHALAFISIPLIGFGFWGLTINLKSKNRSSFLAFTVSCFGLVAVMMAGSLNGFTLPMFASEYANSSVDAAFLQAVRDYGWFLGSTMDYIFIASLSVSIVIWSVSILSTGQLNKWLGYYGIVIAVVTLLAILLKSNFTTEFGFGIYIFSLVSWLVIAALLLIFSSNKIHHHD